MDCLKVKPLLGSLDSHRIIELLPENWVSVSFQWDPCEKLQCTVIAHLITIDIWYLNKLRFVSFHSLQQTWQIMFSTLCLTPLSLSPLWLHQEHHSQSSLCYICRDWRESSGEGPPGCLHGYNTGWERQRAGLRQPEGRKLSGLVSP